MAWEFKSSFVNSKDILPKNLKYRPISAASQHADVERSFKMNLKKKLKN